MMTRFGDWSGSAWFRRSLGGIIVVALVILAAFVVSRIQRRDI